MFVFCQVNAEKLQDVQQKLEAFLAQEKEQKERAQRCFVSYLRSVYLMKNKEVFDVFKLKTNEYALSLGLAVAPRVRFLNKAQALRGKTEAQTPEEQLEEEELRRFKAQLKGAAPREESQSSESEGSGDDEESDSEEPLKPVRKPSQKSESEEEEDDDDLRDLDLLTVKRKDVFNTQGDDESAEESEQSKQASKKNLAKESKFKEAKKVLKRKFQVNTKVTFSEGGEAVQLWPPVQRLATAQDDEEDEEEVSGINVEKAKERLKREDQEFDKQEYRRKVKAKHRETRLKAKAARRDARKKSGQKSDDDDDDDGEEEEEAVVAYLDNNSEDEFDPSMLPDPDKLSSKDDEDGEEEEEEERSRFKRQHSSEISNEDEQELAAGNRKRARRRDEDQAALDTGLSLAEDEELVLHLLGGGR